MCKDGVVLDVKILQSHVGSHRAHYLSCFRVAWVLGGDFYRIRERRSPQELVERTHKPSGLDAFCREDIFHNQFNFLNSH